MSKLIVDLKVGETLTVGDAKVRLEKKSGQLARLRIIADESVIVVPPNTRRQSGDVTPQRMSAAISDEVTP